MIHFAATCSEKALGSNKMTGVCNIVHVLVLCRHNYIQRVSALQWSMLFAVGRTEAKTDELKARTNYYSTQQLIQRCGLDPAQAHPHRCHYSCFCESLVIFFAAGLIRCCRSPHSLPTAVDDDKEVVGDMGK
ncbi:uncharacterized protein [Triticum aestivum]|uniref:uncharacterized protein n=1 Tax=Triticum aestivum TaxID=4565 RepID=UPI001D00FADB|nr:uncharacterized protein LOC123136987 [Triticum aestivum]